MLPLLLIFLLPLVSGYVTPPTLQTVFESKPGSRASNLDSNIRLLTVLNLQQNGWILRGSYFYKLFELDLMWVEAENFCRSMGAHLVSIKDEMENQFVHTLRKKSNIWIGLNKINDPQQVYKWSDGSSADFLNWDSTQPNEPKGISCYFSNQGSALGRLRLHGVSSGTERNLVRLRLQRDAPTVLSMQAGISLSS